MAHPIPQKRIGWRWLLVLSAGLAWLSLGCSPQTLSIFLMPFADTNKEPEYKLFAAGKEVNLVVMASFVDRPFQPEYVPADQELAEHVAIALRKRATENKHTLKIVPVAEVRSLQLKQLAEGGVSPIEIGKKFKADYVLDMSIESFGLYQKDAYPKMFKGSSHINMKLLEVKTGDEVFKKTVNPEFAANKGVPILVGNENPAIFRQAYMRRLGRDLSRTFIAFPLDELKEWD